MQDVTGTAGREIIETLQEKRQAEDYYVIISPYYGKNMRNSYQKLREYTDSCIWLSPVSEVGLLDMDPGI